MTAEKKFRKVIPAGHLYVQGKEYYLLSPCPVQPDWEFLGLERRFAVVPSKSINVTKDLEVQFSFARHIIVKGDYFIEYASNIPEISVWDLGEFDLTNPMEVTEHKEDEPNWHQLELTDMIRSMEESNG